MVPADTQGIRATEAPVRAPGPSVLADRLDAIRGLVRGRGAPGAPAGPPLRPRPLDGPPDAAGRGGRAVVGDHAGRARHPGKPTADRLREPLRRLPQGL